MIIIGLVLSVFGIGFFCWLLFTLAVYALPFFAGLTAGLAAFHSGAGVIGALIVGVLAGGAHPRRSDRSPSQSVRPPLIRAVIGLLFAVPAAIAGYHATLGLAQIGVPSEGWREAFAVVGAIFVGGTAWARMTSVRPARRSGRALRPVRPQLASGGRDQRGVSHRRHRRSVG